MTIKEKCEALLIEDSRIDEIMTDPMFNISFLRSKDLDETQFTVTGTVTRSNIINELTVLIEEFALENNIALNSVVGIQFAGRDTYYEDKDAEL